MNITDFVGLVTVMAFLAMPAYAQTGRLIGEFIDGNNKICVYSVGNSTQYVTQRIASICYLTKRF